MTDLPNSPTNERRAAWPRRALDWAGRYENYWWVLAVAAVLVVQWPMLKGLYYRTTGSAAPASAIEWRTDLDAALAEAARTDKRVLVDFTADWCPPCITMKHDVWPHRDVEAAVARDYVPVLIDVDRDVVVSQRYGVEGIPTILVLARDGRELKRGSFLSPAGMTEFLTAP